MNQNEIPALELTLEPSPEQPVSAQTVLEPADSEFGKVPEPQLTPAEQKMVEEFAAKIDLTNSNQILQYGVGAQKKIADFSESALENVRTKDLGEVGQMLANVVTELKSFEVDEKDKGFFARFKRGGNRIMALKARYAKAEANVDQICEALEAHQVQLLKDISVLDKMYEINKTYFKELSMYLLAGKKKLQQVRSNDLPALQRKAQASGLPEDAQAANDLSNMCDRFEKKLHDLDLTRVISIQMAPQLRLIQNNDLTMSEKIQSTLVNTIPLWKSQMVLALGVEHSTQAAKAQREVTDMTNALLRKNADALKMATIETQKESERGIVDIETLKHTNESLIATLDEVMQIQKESREKRAQAEQELRKLETDLKNKLLQLR
ncbi:toxic anion resistance protein [Caproiciproducens galactitolivorans]|uniref:TelA-like protein n=1 Tax=Caproiciproducens galactitolivorans TaxID=642589 RepID=A0A4Z0YBR9_9FIRM|nr:toxic anion resistance protein [Caproiciproducens galactitolivorans]QEY34889.1 toxic anion resistance protein [Caproiciproducens galactitolivorans]TGJ76410.1 TelA-like protein [Caproiciproducens galactitolivorans]